MIFLLLQRFELNSLSSSQKSFQKNRCTRGATSPQQLIPFNSLFLEKKMKRCECIFFYYLVIGKVQLYNENDSVRLKPDQVAIELERTLHVSPLGTNKRCTVVSFSPLHTNPFIPFYPFLCLSPFYVYLLSFFLFKPPSF